MADPPSIAMLIADEISGREVRGSDGGSVGRVRDVYLQDRDGSLAALAVSPSRFSSREVLIPLAAIQDPLDREMESDSARIADDEPGESSTAGDPASAQDAPDAGPATRATPAADADSAASAAPSTGAATEPSASSRSRAHRITAALVGADAVLLAVTADLARAGAEAPATGHVTPELLRQAARALGIEEAPPA